MAHVMKSPDRRPWVNPQPLSLPDEQRREGDVEKQEIDAARAWLRHVEAGTFDAAK